MSGTTIALIVVAVVVVLAVVAIVAIVRSRRRTATLQERFGPEYGRAVEGENRRDAERELKERIELRDRYRVQPLTAAARERYAAQWHDLQARFVDEPTIAVADADGLLVTVLRERGYPVDDWDERTKAVSVDEPEFVDDYRRAHAVADANRSGGASVDDLRDALLRYRKLFDALLGDDTATAEDAADRDTAQSQ